MSNEAATNSWRPSAKIGKSVWRVLAYPDEWKVFDMKADWEATPKSRLQYFIIATRRRSHDVPNNFLGI